MINASLRGRVRLLATTMAVVLTLLLAAGAGCDSQRDPELPSVQEKLEQTHIFGQSKLRIGVATYEPLMGVLENNKLVGFDIDIARYIAASLGYEGDAIQFIHLATEDRIPALQSGQVDIVVSSFSITEERQKLVSFAGPYFVTTQEVMIPVAMKNKIRTIEDLRNPNYRVCVGGGSTTEAELEKHGIKTLVVKNVRDCVNGMRNKKRLYDAVSSDETILAGFRSMYPTEFEIVDLPFGTSEQLGVGVPISDPALRDLVAYFLHQSYLAGRSGKTSPWLTAYHQNLGPWLDGEREQPPPLNVPELVDFDDKAPV
ncbi:transporter substrate-binding domain-containing protein [Plantactinospora solaniradicis]|uniref:Transporter substrate-binding domain-containing protein n=1 Tax=Plantactinospora solaniradicis TaxID=1723736 RepID=A0ABW1K1B8_9ACTN